MKPHGIMFHHFYDNLIHVNGQGAISSQEFENMIDYLSEQYIILNADEWRTKALRNQLKENEICITFDDALKCQYDIAYPVLKSRGITAFWFVYSSILEGKVEMLEIYRYFRTSKFKDIEEFYDQFFKLLLENENKIKLDIKKEIKVFKPDKYLKEYKFYTDNDKLFRYLRDVVLKYEKYNYFMELMIDKFNYDIDTCKQILWINCENIKNIYEDGNIIGIHSHTHPTVIEDLSYKQQMHEYRKCKETLSDVIGSDKDIDCIAHPCNSYNSDTLEILQVLGMRLGFRSNIAEGYSSLLEKPREDHANILKEMRKIQNNYEFRRNIL